MIAVQSKGFPVAGQMLPDSGVKNLAKLSFPFADKGNDFPPFAGGVNWIATADSRAALGFETSTRRCKVFSYAGLNYEIIVVIYAENYSGSECGAVSVSRIVWSVWAEFSERYRCAREFKDTLEAIFVTSTRDDVARWNEFSESIKKGLMFHIVRGYGYSAPAKSGAGIGVSNDCMAIHDAPSVFFCVVSSVHPFFSDTGIIRAAHKIMVGWVGASSEAPESIQSGYANLTQSTTNEIGVSGGGRSEHCMEAAKWLLPPPKIRNLSGLSPLFAAICRQSTQKFTISPHRQSGKPAVLWLGITSAFSLAAFVWRWLMRNYFRITGYAVNKRGLTVGIGYQVTSSSLKAATAHAMLQAQREGLSHVRITRVQEVAV